MAKDFSEFEALWASKECEQMRDELMGSTRARIEAAHPDASPADIDGASMLGYDKALPMLMLHVYHSWANDL